MPSNFDFLKDTDKELFDTMEEAQRLYRSEYFNQCVITVRIFGEKMAKKILPADNSQTFDDILNTLKDKIKTQREKELIDDLFFIKKEGNSCAHGEKTSAMNALEVIKRAFEAGINYAYLKKPDKKTDSLRFDETLLITEVKKEDNKIIDKYLSLAQSESEALEENREFAKSEEKAFKKNKKEEIKKKIKQAKKNLKEKINKEEVKKNKTEQQKEKPAKKSKNTSRKQTKTQKNKFIKLILFLIFFAISLFLLIKIMI